MEKLQFLFNGNLKTACATKFVDVGSEQGKRAAGSAGRLRGRLEDI